MKMPSYCQGREGFDISLFKEALLFLLQHKLARPYSSHFRTEQGLFLLARVFIQLTDQVIFLDN